MNLRLDQDSAMAEVVREGFQLQLVRLPVSYADRLSVLAAKQMLTWGPKSYDPGEAFETGVGNFRLQLVEGCYSGLEWIVLLHRSATVDPQTQTRGIRLWTIAYCSVWREEALQHAFDL